MDIRDDERVSAYIDGEMNDLEAARFERELLKNPELEALVTELRSMRQVMQRLAASEAPKTMFGRVMDAVDVDAARTGRTGLAARRRFGMPVMSLALAASAVLIMYGLSSSVAPPPATGPAASPDAAPAVKLESSPPMPRTVPLSSSPGPIYMAPDAYRFKGAGALEITRAAASTVGASFVTKAGEPAAAPNEKGEIWLDIDASQVSRFRAAMENKVIIESIGMGRVIEGRIRLRLLLVEQP